MNFFLSLFRSKLDNLRAAAPRASIRLLHESNGFSAYLDETAAVRKVTQLGTLEDKSEEIFIDAPVLTLFVPLDQMVRFMDEVTAHHSVALVDVLLPTKEDKARYVMYAYFPKKPDQTITERMKDFASTLEFDQVIVTGGDTEPFAFGPKERRFMVEPVEEKSNFWD